MQNNNYYFILFLSDNVINKNVVDRKTYFFNYLEIVIWKPSEQYIIKSIFWDSI